MELRFGVYKKAEENIKIDVVATLIVHKLIKFQKFSDIHRIKYLGNFNNIFF